MDNEKENAQKAPIVEPSATEIDLRRKQRSGARCFLLIGALSLFNSIFVLSGFDVGFSISLGATRVIDSFFYGLQLGVISKTVAFALNSIVAGIMILFGVMSLKGMGWAYVIGLVMYAFDGIISLLCRDWLGAAFHVFLMWFIYSGWRANRDLEALRAPAAQASNTPPV